MNGTLGRLGQNVATGARGDLMKRYRVVRLISADICIERSTCKLNREGTRMSAAKDWKYKKGGHCSDGRHR